MTSKPAIRQDNAAVSNDIESSQVLTTPKDRLADLKERVGVNGVKISSMSHEENDRMFSGGFPAVPLESEEADPEQDTVLVLDETNAMPVELSKANRFMHASGLLATVTWLGFSAYALVASQALANLSVTNIQAIGGIIAAVLAPVALLWVAIQHMMRGNDIHRYSAALRKEFQSILFPTGERAQQMNTDMERLCQQAAELATSSKAVIKAISRARHGLRTEIRDFVGISKKTEFHIDRLADTLQERASTLSSLTNEIEERAVAITVKSQAGTEAWELATAKVVERSTEMESAIGRGAERLKGLSDDFDSHTRGLSTAIVTVSGETEKLSGSIKEQIQKLEDTAKDTIQAMSKSGQAIEDQRKALDQGAEKVVQQAEQIAETIQKSVGGLSVAGDHIVDCTNALENRIAAQSDRLRDTVSTLAGDAGCIEEAGSAAAHKLSQAVSTAISGAEAIGNAVRRAVEQLEKSTDTARKQTESLIESTQESVARLNEAGEGNAVHVRETVSLFEAQRDQIEAAATSANAQLENLSAAIEQQTTKFDMSTANMADHVKAMQTALEEPLRSLNGAITDADTRHQQIEETLRRRVADLNEASEKARDTAEHIRSILHNQSLEISKLSGQISGNTRVINEQMGDQREGLTAAVRDSLENMKTVGETLERQAQRMAELSENAVLDVARVEKQLASRCAIIGDETTATISTLDRLDNSLNVHCVSIKERGETAVSSVQTVMGALKASASDFEPLMNRAIGQATEAKARFEELNGGFQSSSSSNLEMMQKVGIVFDARLTSLRSGVEEAEVLLKTAGEALQSRVEEIGQAAQDAGSHAHDVEKALQTQATDIHLITDQSLLKIENIRQELNGQFHELSESIGQALAQLDSVGQHLNQSAGNIDSIAERAVIRFDEVGVKVRMETDLLSEAAKASSKQTDETALSLSNQTEALRRSAREALSDLKKAGDGLSLKAMEIAEQMATSIKTSRDYGEELRRQTGAVADSSAASADNISRSVALLNARIDDIGGAAGATLIKIDRSRDSLSQEAERLITISTTSIKTAEEASITFGRQSSALFKAVQDASHMAEKVRKEEGRVQRGAFMASAKFIVESLHSLSVDFSRMLEGSVPEKTWKAFQKGDIGAFTRRLVQLGDNLPVEKIRDKFASDNEFRTYVQRFIRQFEDVYEQAVANDHGDLLGSTFATSDIGRLYMILCAAAGREAKLNREDKLVA